MAEQAPWKQEGEATAKLLTAEDQYRGQETGQLFTQNAMPAEGSGETVKIPNLYSEANSRERIPKNQDFNRPSQAQEKEEQPPVYVTLYEMESES